MPITLEMFLVEACPLSISPIMPKVCRVLRQVVVNAAPSARAGEYCTVAGSGGGGATPSIHFAGWSPRDSHVRVTARVSSRPSRSTPIDHRRDGAAPECTPLPRQPEQ